MDPTEASNAAARGGDRTPCTHARRTGRSIRGALGVMGLVVAVLLAPGTARAATRTGAGDAPGTSHPAAAASHGADTLTLVRQSPWVGPRAPDQSLTLGLRIGSRQPSADLSLVVTVYEPLTSRTAFDETLGGRGLGAVTDRSPALALTSLATDAQGVTDLTIPVGGDTAPTTTGNWTADLHCAVGSCADVYPVKITLEDSAGSGADLVTYLVYDDPSTSSQPLRVALVAPLSVGPVVPDATGKVHPLSAAAADGLQGLVSALGSAPTVPVTLEPDPATLELLADSGRTREVQALSTLTSSTARQSLASSFVTVDPTALVDAGLGGELGAQQRRADAVLAGLGVRATGGTWVTQQGLDQATVDQLAGADPQVVVPPSSVSGPTGPLTVTQPFTLTSGRGESVTAAVSDAGLAAHLQAAEGSDPVLAAEQMLADLSFVYDEVPNLRGPSGAPAPRGVVAVAPSPWTPAPSFVTTLLDGLESNPVLVPVTLDQLFTQVPVGSDGEASTRRPLGTAPAGLAARALRTARARQNGFASAAAGSPQGAATVTRLEDLLLATESSALGPRQQQSAVAGYEAALHSQLSLLAVRSDTIRLTAGTANVPITLVRNTPYPVTVMVQLTSDKLGFPGAASQSPGAQCKSPQVQSTAGRSSFSTVCVLDRTTDAVYVDMRARTSGDFRIEVTLASPSGGLVLAGGALTVRSLSASAVAIVLSAAALVVLGVWWGRTMWRGRGRGRRGAHSRAPAGSPA